MFWGIVFILGGSLWLLKNLGIIPNSVELFWPVFFVAIGLSMVLNSLRPERDWYYYWSDKKDK